MKPSAQDRLRTMKVGLEPSHSRPDERERERKQSGKQSLQEISSHASVLYRQELWDYIFLPNPE